jgi:hypothetical protein
MTMLETAVAALASDRRVWNLNELRVAAGVAIRSGYKLSEQLRADPRVRSTGNSYSLRPVPLSLNDIAREANKLRYDAHLAYLDGRVQRARELNRRADGLERAL